MDLLGEMCYNHFMTKSNRKLRVIFNDSIANLPSKSLISQGGVSRFAQKFSKSFNNNFKDIELLSLVFSIDQKNKGVILTEKSGKHTYYKLFYPGKLLSKSYTKKYTKKEHIKLLSSWVDDVLSLFKEIKPDILFLNGFSLSNWVMLEAAHKLNIPICIQHAGLWKKELYLFKNSISPSIKRIFSSYEKDVYLKASHQIFLNEFSRDVFFSIHNIPKNKKTLSKTSIIPLPIDIKKKDKIKIINKKQYNIGSVARWDGIKNHDAILRLAKYTNKKHIPRYINVVTMWDKNNLTDFKKNYVKFIKIINPMPQEKLINFYKSQDVIIIPSRFDVSPTVLMEAISCGKPVIISSNVGWKSDYIKFGLSKLIISPSASGKTINDTIDELLKNKNKYILGFEKLQKKIINEHNKKIVFGKYYNIFQRLS